MGKLSSAVVANSRAGLCYYRFPRGHVLYNCIDLSRFHQSAERTGGRLVMTANFSDYKDHATLFAAVTPLLRDGLVKDVTLLGQGPYLQRWKDRFAGSDLAERIRFLGSRGDVEDILAGCDVGVLCSTRRYKEGISNAILEYMAAGLVAVASDIGGTNEIIEDGVNGYLFECEDPDDLSRKLRMVLQDGVDKQRLRENALETLRTKFDAETNTRQLIALYRSLAR